MAIFDSLSKYRNTGLLIIRIGLGAMFMLHGYPKLLGGVEQWELIGGAIKYTGIDFLFVLWGLLGFNRNFWGIFNTARINF
jgi:putative oxidoreductase